MCAITGSFNLDWLESHYSDQLTRGNMSSSIAAVQWSESISVNRVTGTLAKTDFENAKTEGAYYITHSQAPTGKTSADNIHPSELSFMYGGASYLWHNGVITEKSLAELNKRYVYTYTWDTKLIHQMVMTYDDLSEIDGTFACVFVSPEKDVFVFRNELAPLFIGKDLNISSTKFDNMEELPAGQLWYMNLLRKELIATGISFTTKQPLYYFGD